MSRFIKDTANRRSSKPALHYQSSSPYKKQLNTSANSLFVTPSLIQLRKQAYKSPNSSLNMSQNSVPVLQSDTLELSGLSKENSLSTKNIMDLKNELTQKTSQIKDLQDLLSESLHKNELLKVKIRFLRKENKKLQINYKDFSVEIPNKTIFELELNSKCDDIRKLENQLNVYEEQTKRIIKEKDFRIKMLESKHGDFDKNTTRSELHGIIKQFQKDNSKLRERIYESATDISVEDHERLKSQFNELEMLQNTIILENKNLKTELDFYKIGSGKTLINFSHDILRINKQISQLGILLKT